MGRHGKLSAVLLAATVVAGGFLSSAQLHSYFCTAMRQVVAQPCCPEEPGEAAAVSGGCCEFQITQLSLVGAVRPDERPAARLPLGTVAVATSAVAAPTLGFPTAARALDPPRTPLRSRRVLLI